MANYNIDNEISDLHEIINSAEDYDVTNINGLINVACDNPELFDRLVRAIKDNEYAKFDLSAYASERIEDLGL